MTTFVDGPAHEKTIMLKRAPLYLRVVINPAGFVDALDQLEDTPKAEESVHAYRREGNPTWCHINRARSAGGSGVYTIATYRHIAVQPPEETIRDSDAWRRWTVIQFHDAKHRAAGRDP